MGSWGRQNLAQLGAYISIVAQVDIFVKSFLGIFGVFGFFWGDKRDLEGVELGQVEAVFSGVGAVLSEKLAVFLD